MFSHIHFSLASVDGTLLFVRYYATCFLRISVKMFACHKLRKVPKNVQQIGSCGMPKKNQGTVRDLQTLEANGG